ncbi:hypothetical protein GUITHDRAFT_110309 [Guillardia theta CCMP2712]|uniref:Uncharacterized protein n=1 Tax=Guillardia theta (strain CCMP2712) TaxID=905079 RepID=L1J6Y1_GUITC|nr:hypothetical protein GUITHDRAFT_110309 [Guillardia theta CCMP2712]EKX43859.1 hypothetical protein GUITHDRAFT_110309 [Guillardia theta CCMP2712]|eukprot:XP_005830839.1 hypothetical protein GUITHDRAFT_110309 [Guillardia theta CCMP2712]
MLSREEREALQKVEEWMAKSQAPEEVEDETETKPRSRLRRSMSVDKTSELVNNDETLARRQKLRNKLNSMGGSFNSKMGGSFNSKRGSLNMSRSPMAGIIERTQSHSTNREDTGRGLTGGYKSQQNHDVSSPLERFTAGLIGTALDWTNTNSPKSEGMSRSNSIQDGLTGLFSFFTNPKESNEASDSNANAQQGNTSDSSEPEQSDHFDPPNSGDSSRNFRGWEEKARLASEKAKEAKAAAGTARDNFVKRRASTSDLMLLDRSITM